MFFHESFWHVITTFEALKLPYYIHAGVGLHFHGIASELDDIDIRVYHPNISTLHSNLQRQRLPAISLRSTKSYAGGQYNDDCITIHSAPAIDICGQMRFNCDLGKVTFPFDEAWFKDTVTVRPTGRAIHVAPLEKLLLYYLILRRDSTDGKNDIQRHTDFSPAKFNAHLNQFEPAEAAELRRIYTQFRTPNMALHHP